MSERRRMIALLLCLVLIAGAVLWGQFGGHEIRCWRAVTEVDMTASTERHYFKVVACDASAVDLVRQDRAHPLTAGAGAR